MLKIWGRISSINVRKVVLAAQWLGIPFERVDAGHEFGIVRTPQYLAMNPNALVPTIEDDGFQLYESNVIVRYLSAKHAAAGLYPQDLRQRFDAERWMDWQQTTLNPAGRNAFVQLLRTPAEKRQQKLVDDSIAAAAEHVEKHESHASQVATSGVSTVKTDNSFMWVNQIYNWIEVGDPAKAGTSSYLHVNVGYLFDSLSGTMLCVV